MRHQSLVPAFAVAGVLCGPVAARAQMPVSVGQRMPDFSLPAVQGGKVSLAGLSGKNVLLIFPRGKVGDHWCQICHYQYAELVELEQQTGLRARHDLEIVFVLPYGPDEVQAWADMFPGQMEVIEGWKDPPNAASLTEGERRWMETAREYFPKSYTYENGDIPVPFPILADADQTLSRRLRLFTANWDGSAVEQNIPTVFLLDRDGVVQFKYHSQTTFDRPTPDYLVRVIERMLTDR